MDEAQVGQVRVSVSLQGTLSLSFRALAGFQNIQVFKSRIFFFPLKLHYRQKWIEIKGTVDCIILMMHVVQCQSEQGAKGGTSKSEKKKEKRCKGETLD